MQGNGITVSLPYAFPACVLGRHCLEILEQMNEDELHHRHTALEAGGVELPYAVKITMTGISKLMTKTSYYL